MAASLVEYGVGGSALCPVCGLAAKNLSILASHLVERAEVSDGSHVMWLNRNMSKHRLSAEELERLLVAALAGDGPSNEVVKR
ncbi:MAG: DUF5810 domain-containing protein [Actinomycetota bacterium]|jgi:hypothetical protein|nr:DUF5810 domain-containing protein [Actinomycetota bacterium]